MEELTGILQRATEAIERSYFQVMIDGSDPVFRERVYCYELYHQMRCRWPVGCKFYLNGELDKAGHAILRGLGVNAVKPDLLVHTPGYMVGNHAIFEVKPVECVLRAIRKDLSTLKTFVCNARYERAVYLFFGAIEEGRLRTNVEAAMAGMEHLPPIELWLHRQPEEAALQIATLGC